MNIDLALTAIITLLTRASEISALIASARAEGRDVTDAELDELGAKDDLARAELRAAIDAARSGAGP